MVPVTQRKLNIDIVDTIRGQGQGVELKRSGHIYKAVCPFHGEENPSFVVYPENHRFHCFGCRENGDVIDFMQRFHGLDFKDALGRLGLNQGPLTIADKNKIAEAARKRKRRQARARRETELAWTLGTLIRRIHSAKKALTPENLHIYCGVLDPLSLYEWGHDTLIYGSKEEKADVLNCFKGFETIERGQLFINGFDFEKWLRESGHKRILNSAKKYRDTNGTPNEFKTGSIEIPVG